MPDTLGGVSEQPNESPAAGPTGARRGRPRDAGRDQQILLAAQELLAEVGYEQFTMEAVAARVGASKPTLYRRWASRAELVAAAIGDLQWSAPTPDTGSLRSDLVELAGVWFAEDSTRDAVFVRLLAALPFDEQLRELYVARVSTPRGLAMEQVLGQALARGEIRDGAPGDSLRGILPALVFHRLVVDRLPVDRSFIESVIDDVIIPSLTGPAHKH